MMHIPGVAVLECFAVERTCEGEDLWIRDGVGGYDARSEGVSVI